MDTRRQLLKLKRVNLRYHDIAHGVGGLLWWLDNAGKMKTYISTGTEMHHDLDRRVDMDARWRGRIELATGRATILPPLHIYNLPTESMRLPRTLIKKLSKLGGRLFYLDTGKGMYLIAPANRSK